MTRPIVGLRPRGGRAGSCAVGWRRRRLRAIGSFSPLLAHQPRALAIPVALLLGLALVVQLLAASEAEFHFGAAARVEIHLQRDQREAFALRGTDQLRDLPLVQKQPARTARLVIEAVGLQVFGDIG